MSIYINVYNQSIYDEWHNHKLDHAYIMQVNKCFPGTFYINH